MTAVSSSLSIVEAGDAGRRLDPLGQGERILGDEVRLVLGDGLPDLLDDGRRHRLAVDLDDPVA